MSFKQQQPKHVAQAQTNTRSSDEPSLTIVAGIIIGMVLLGLITITLLSVFFNRIDRTEQFSPEQTTVFNVILGAQHYAIPAALLSDPLQPLSNFVEKIELKLLLPLGENRNLQDFSITLLPRGKHKATSDLLDTVYVHQFTDEPQQAQYNLVGKSIASTRNGATETVWFDPLSPKPFAAKCMQSPSNNPADPTCMRVFKLSDRNLAVASFSPQALENWKIFDETIEFNLLGLRK